MSARTSSFRPLRHPLALAVALALLPLAPAAFAVSPPLPTGFNHTGLYGNVEAPSLDATGRTMTITQQSKGAIITWDGFNIGGGYHVDFKQPSTDSVTLNRVTGVGASQIDGALTATGRVFLVNPNGVLFGSGAQVSVGGLVASTLNISDADFQAGVGTGRFAFTGNVNGGSSTVSNAGNIIATTGGTIALLSADSVSNSGNINAPGGTISLGWGRALELDIGGDGLTKLIITPNAGGHGKASIVNNGTLQADGGQVVVRADLGDTSGVVNHSGIVRARSLQSRGGQIVLDAGGNELDISGSNDASATGAGVAGGSITASANRLLVNTGAAFNAGGGSGGANGNLTISSISDVLITSAGQITADLANNLHSSNTHLLDSALGGALSKNTDVTLNNLGQANISGGHNGGTVSMLDGITFPYTPQQITSAPAQIIKNAGGDARLTINANRDIVMTNGTAITSSSGSLGVDFNADSTGLPASVTASAKESGGHIALDGARISSNGGAIRFYGQSDPINGRTTGSVGYIASINFFPINPDGINLNDSTLDTCAYVGTSCGGSGGINLRGQGIDYPTLSPITGGRGISALGSTLRTGSGAISLDGTGATVASGVVFDNDINSDTGVLTSPGAMQSLSGTIDITGHAGNEAIAGSAAYYDKASGVLLGAVPILTGADISVQGTGATRSVTGSAQSIAPSDGVHIQGATMRAGAGRSIRISGQAGSAGIQVDPATGIRTPVPVYGVYATGGSLVGSSGTLAMHGLAGSDLYVGTTLDASAANGAGGQITLDGGNILLADNAALLADGSSGGQIGVTAGKVLALSAKAGASASALTAGNGGNIRLFGTQGLYAYGLLRARGGTSSGNGGVIETSGSGIDLRGIKVNTGAASGMAGTWLIDPYDVNIVPGTVAVPLPTNPFTPIATSTIQDVDINFALNGGSNVTITTGTGGSTTNGSITINGGVNILRNNGTTPVTFRLDANTNISGNGPFTIQSSAGALNLVFDSNANNINTNNGNISFSGANLRTNGGSIAMFGQNDPVNGFAQSFVTGISLYQSTLDTRVAVNDANPGGAISLRGSAGYYGGGTGVSLGQTDLHSSTGNIGIFGVGTGGGSGVSLTASTLGAASQITTTSGSLAITGIGSSSGTQFGRLDGVSSVNYALQSTTGAIDLRGYGAVNGSNGNAAVVPNDGLVLDSLTTVASGSGNVYLSGSSAGSGAGVSLVSTQVSSTALASATVNSGTGNIVVRAHNDGTTDALVLNGTLTSAGTTDLRPGGVDVNGALTENPNDAIALGGATGFALSATEIGNITAHDLVLGSNSQTGAITVSAPITYTHNLTLDNGAGGGIAINGTLNVGTNTLALVSAGNITQTAPVTAASLLAQSSAGLVNLGNAGNNVSANTVAGTAAGSFTFYNAGDLGIGPVNALGFGAAANAPIPLAASGISAGGNVLAWSLGGNLLLNGNIIGNAVDLVAGGPNGLFLNTAGATITATSYWHVWASSWIGENRGGLVGNGVLPNLYGCAYSAICTVKPSPTAHQFIYVAQPLATVNLTNATRQYALPNNAIAYAVNGMILGDLAANAITGTTSTTATQASHVGSYPISGNFTSPAGYLVRAVPGALAITPATLTYVANPYSRLYGSPNAALTGTVNGFLLADTQASATAGTLAFTTPATQASNVGSYAINGSGLSATDYVFTQAPGNATALNVTPATLIYTADPLRRLVGTPNGVLGGNVSGFRNNDSLVNATTGTLAFQTPASLNSPVGIYGIVGTGLSANNYIFVQANGNAQALTITPPLQTYTLDVQRDTPVTYVYDRNFGIVGLCPATDLAAGSRDKDGDILAREWSRVRSRPNLANCVSTKQKNSCGDF